MCGIWGQLNRRGAPPDESVGRAALAAIGHRGPDSRGLWRGDGVLLGACRLAIVDLDGGDQPIVDNERQCCIVYNGELYNLAELRAELVRRGERFATRSDTEVVLRAYLVWGYSCLERLDGMFAFAIWDGRSRTLFLARDRIGEKPLYLYRDARRIVFASEIKAILADPSIPRDLDEPGLLNVLAFGHGAAPQTILRGIEKVMPASYVVADAANTLSTEYWNPAPAPDAGLVTDEREAAEELAATLEESVRRRLVADVPVGVFLSGGLDSSAVTAFAARHVSGRLLTFSLGFPGHAAYDERGDAALVAERFGTDHHELTLEAVDVPGELSALAAQYDEPFADPAALPTLLLSRFARRSVKAVLGGDGGDELFGGYRRYVAERFAPLCGVFPGSAAVWALRRTLGRMPRFRRAKLAAETLAIPEPARRWASWVGVFGERLRDRIAAPEVVQRAPHHDPSAALARQFYGLGERVAADPLNRVMFVDVRTWLPDKMLEKTDRASMAASLEVRAPFLDHRLVELAFRIPSRMKVRGLRTKVILRRALAGVVPDAVLSKPKRGFSVPYDPWFRGELLPFARAVLLDETTRRRRLIDVDAAARLIDAHESGREVLDRQILLLVNLELWARAVLDRAGI